REKGWKYPTLAEFAGALTSRALTEEYRSMRRREFDTYQLGQGRVDHRAVTAGLVELWREKGEDEAVQDAKEITGLLKRCLLMEDRAAAAASWPRTFPEPREGMG